ncbi:MAG: glycosyl transferase family 2 [Caulobacter sp.]|nr:glycosyl transferase family 2 [Caulobacter sp.]
MNARASEWIVDNKAWKTARARLSVLIPFKGDDPARLLAALDLEQADAEIVLLDDGTNDGALTERLTAQVEALRLPVRFVRLAANQGRAKGRNTLASHARAPHLLFLDSDMLPDSPAFLTNWLAIANADTPVAFGGFSLKQTPQRREHALHRAMALKTDCTPAPERARQPEKHVFTSNLLVRRDVFQAIGFDEAFAGWGWEDVEWAMRVTRAHPILHADNPATHLGLDTARDIAGKYEQSVANFGRVAQLHPDIVAAYPSHRVAKLLKRLPLRTLWRPLFKALALADAAPLPARALAMRLYRTALYADVV